MIWRQIAVVNPILTPAVSALRLESIITGIQFVTDDKGRRVAVQIDRKKHRAIWQDFWDGLISEARRKEKGIPYDQYRASRLKRNRSRG